MRKKKPEQTIDQEYQVTEMPEHFEKKVVRLVLQRYKKFYGTPWIEVQHVDSFERLSSLPYMCLVGGHKQASKINLGALLNSFHKSEIASRFGEFQKAARETEEYLYLFSIPTSTALYVIIPGEILHPSLVSQMRFITYTQHNNDLVTILRFDDYLNWKWPVQE